MTHKKTGREPVTKTKPKADYFTDRHLLFSRKYVELGYNGSRAAEAAGFAKTYASRLLKLEKVQQCIREIESELAKTEAFKIARENERAESRGVSKSALAELFWRLANLSPAETNGNITGQVKAGAELGELMGYKVQLRADLTKEFEGRSEKDLDYFSKNGYFPNDVDAGQSRPN